MEQVVYDPESGQLLTASFMDYAMPRADTMPDMHDREQPRPDQAQPDRRQGRRRGRHRRRAAGGDQRGDGRAGAASASASSTCRLPSERVWHAIQARASADRAGETSWATKIDDRALDLLLRKARTQNGWLPTPVTDDQLRAIYDIMRMGPTSANSCPARVRLPAHAGGQGPAAARADPGQRGQDQGGAGHGDHRLRHALLRVDAQEALHPPAGDGRQLREERRAGRDHGVPQRHAAGRLLHAGRARGRARRRRACPASTTPRSTPSSSPTAASSPTSCATSATAIPSKVLAKLPRLDFDEACTLL